MAVIKIKRKSGFDPKTGDIFLRVRLTKDHGWIYAGRCKSVKEAKMKGSAYGENVEYIVTVNGDEVFHQKINKGSFPGKIASAGHPTLGKKKP
jgi:hypothetical protein